MNKICISGTIVRDCDLRFTQNNKAVTKFTIANNVGFGENQKCNFVNVVMFGCENLANYLIKGQKVNITGQLSINSYEKDGAKKYITEVIADSFQGVELIGGKSNASGNNNFNSYNNDSSDNAFGGCSSFDGPDEITQVEDDGSLPF